MIGISSPRVRGNARHRTLANTLDHRVASLRWRQECNGQITLNQPHVFGAWEDALSGVVMQAAQLNDAGPGRLRAARPGR
jgi:hypothetical protein